MLASAFLAVVAFVLFAVAMCFTFGGFALLFARMPGDPPGCGTVLLVLVMWASVIPLGTGSLYFFTMALDAQHDAIWKKHDRPLLH